MKIRVFNNTPHIDVAGSRSLPGEAVRGREGMDQDAWERYESCFQGLDNTVLDTVIRYHLMRLGTADGMRLESSRDCTLSKVGLAAENSSDLCSDRRGKYPVIGRQNIGMTVEEMCVCV